MLAREIGTDDLRADVGGCAVNLYPLPGAVPARIRKEALHGFGVEVALAFEVPVKAAMRQAGFRHDLVDRHAIETEPIEQPAGNADDRRLGRSAVARRVRHWLLRCSPSARSRRFSPKITDR